MNDENVGEMITACDNTRDVEFRADLHSTFMRIHHLTDEYLILDPNEQTYLFATKKMAEIYRELKTFRKLAKAHFGVSSESRRTRRRPLVSGIQGEGLVKLPAACRNCYDFDASHTICSVSGNQISPIGLACHQWRGDTNRFDCSGLDNKQ